MSPRRGKPKRTAQKAASSPFAPSRSCASPPSTLPPLYARWMAELLPGPIPRETDATCDDCAMWPGPGEQPRSDGFFLPETKCCTYFPALPNYLVGRILEDGDPASAAGRATIEERIEARIGVTPVGLESSPVHTILYQHGRPLAFGHSRRLRCPHYREDTGGLCGIWRHRNGTCATWYCKHVRGAVGLRFWQTLDQLLTITEKSLGRWCALALHLDAETLHRLFPPGTDRVMTEPLDGGQIDEVVDDERYRRLWGNWAGREREFYRKAARLVDALTWREVAEISGTDVRLFAHLAVDRYRDLVSPRTPKRLTAGPFQVVSAGPDRTRVAGYSGLNPLDLPTELMRVLPCFDGRPTPEVLRMIREKHGLRLTPGLIRKLADFAILAPPRAVS